MTEPAVYFTTVLECTCHSGHQLAAWHHGDCEWRCDATNNYGDRCNMRIRHPGGRFAHYHTVSGPFGDG